MRFEVYVSTVWRRLTEGERQEQKQLHVLTMQSRTNCSSDCSLGHMETSIISQCSNTTRSLYVAHISAEASYFVKQALEREVKKAREVDLNVDEFEEAYEGEELESQREDEQVCGLVPLLHNRLVVVGD